jgi:lipoprotein-anchoring transpeptidase ErfK/SrfK
MVLCHRREPNMQFSRRNFLTTALTSGLLLGQMARSSNSEPFPVANDGKRLPYKFQRREMAFASPEPEGTIVVDPVNRLLYLVLGNGQALRYGVSVGHGAHAWTGEAVIKKMAEWPVWVPAPYHIAGMPSLAKYLPGGMPGGPDNPLGARAMYLFKGQVDTINRIHGGAKLTDIGRKKTAGCIGMLNADVIDLYSRVTIGTRVVMLG